MLRFLLLSGCFILGCAGSAAAADLTEVRALAADKSFDQALEEIEKLLELEPRDLETRLFRGVILTRQGKVNEAIRAFDELALEFPNRPEPHNNLAVLYASQHRYDGARKALLRALELQPRYDTAYENLGDVYAKLAAIAYDRAFQLNRTNERARVKATQLANTLALDAAAPDFVSKQPTTLARVSAQQSNDEAQLSQEPALNAQEAPNVCYSGGPIISEETMQQMSAWLDTRGSGASARSTFEPIRFGFRVYLPPLESKAAALVQIAQMKTEGVKDIGRLTSNGIALGVYATQTAATRRAAQIENMGYKPQIEDRTREQPVWYLEFAANTQVDPAAFATQFPDTALTVTPCTQE